MEYLRLESEQPEADDNFQTCREAIGVGPGWVSLENHDEARKGERKLKWTLSIWLKPKKLEQASQKVGFSTTAASKTTCEDDLRDNNGQEMRLQE